MKEELTRVEFTKEMKKDYTLLIPSMAKIHFELLKNVFRNYGYHVEPVSYTHLPSAKAGSESVTRFTQRS